MPTRTTRAHRTKHAPKCAGAEPRLELVTPAYDASPQTPPSLGNRLMFSPSTREQTARSVASRAAALVDAVEQGRILEAVERFYANDVALGRGALAPMFGFEIPAARGFLRRHVDAEWCGFTVHGIGVNGDTSFIECTLEFCARSGERLQVDQVAVAQWEGGRIVRECLLPSTRARRGGVASRARARA